ncbi:GGDEF domain-containing protein [Vibrio sp. Isolate34]|uniref:GGDEF domain-containing protein n=1 Tax=Vibrio sp. Isolate34 TaxID=2908540 RepID=UPI001EFDD6A5|nr:GGDEF domain-containing protein [Vibrio sp. Isolate34]MCG9641317.1 GGDEF domain-containing protein [Vibrio sp. Isolate34]
MDGYSLDMRTLNFIIILFSFIYCIGLLLFQFTQQSIKGLSMFSISIFVIGTGPLLLSLRGEAPDWISVIGANMVIVLGFHLTLYSLCMFREYSLKCTYLSGLLILALLPSFIYFTYYVPSIKARIIIISVYLAFVTLCTAFAVLKGQRDDLTLATRMMALSFAVYSGFMAFRVSVAFFSAELNDFMAAGLIHQAVFLFSIVLIVSMSFTMLWMINARLHSSIHDLSYRDHLTTLGNRRALDEMVPVMMKQVSTNPVSAIMMDIDNFKSINDQHGHIVGDLVIKSSAEMIQSVIKTSPASSAFRFGGDEIMILLPNVDFHHAQLIASDLRLSISKITAVQGNDLSLTSSFGVAQLHQHESWDEFIGRTDKALYQAKKNGRNRISVCPSHINEPLSV